MYNIRAKRVFTGPFFAIGVSLLSICLAACSFVGGDEVDVGELSLSSGSYFVRIIGETFTTTERITVVR